MISAIILAAGKSARMGRPKMLLPWGKTTVLGKVISTIQKTGIQDILVVTGGSKREVDMVAASFHARTIHNEKYETQEMLGSIQLGLKEQLPDSEAALVCLGDQPQIEERTVAALCERFTKQDSILVVPSHKGRRGHPWLVARTLWDDLIQLNPSESPRDFLGRHASEITYVLVGTSSIIEDLDTPDDYLKYKP